MPQISILLKPASSSCNMRCLYCFYADVTKQREIANYGMMSVDTVEVIIKKALEFADGFASFGFQGGEPTLAGLEFFETVVALQKKYNRKGVKIHNALQTNGLKIDRAWAEFFKREGFLIGLSLDGNEAVHDRYRFDAAGNGSFERVLAAAKLMEECGVEFNILSTVNADVAKNADKIYHFFKKQGFSYLQFIPCLDEFENIAHNREYSLTPKAYGKFLCRLFDLWYADLFTAHPVSVRYFDNLLSMMLGYPPESCGMAGQCTGYFMIESDGSVFPCDFYVTDEWYMGNILHDDWDTLKDSENAKRFLQVSKQVHPDCKVCRHYRICRGGCRRNREPISMEFNGKNYFCSSFLQFFDNAYPKLLEAAKRISNKRS